MTLQDRIAELVQQYGSLDAVSDVVFLSPRVLELAMNENYSPSDYLLQCLGLRRVVSYERLEREERA